MRTTGDITDNGIFSWVFIAAGSAMCAAALNLFFVPCGIMPGGFSGIAAIIHRLTGGAVPIGAGVFALNVPLFLLAYRQLGARFLIKTFYALAIFSALSDILPEYALTEERVLAAVYGGAAMGAGLGAVMRFGACTGGADLLATVINRKVRIMSTSLLLLIIDGGVIAASAFIFGIQSALLAAASVFIMSKIIEIMTETSSSGRVYIIISKKHGSIKKRILHELGRGVTDIYAKGGMSQNNTQMIMCAVDRRFEAAAIGKIIREEDPSAFFMALKAGEIRGEGF